MNAIVCLPGGHHHDGIGLATFKNPHRSGTIVVGKSAYLGGSMEDRTIAVGPGLGFGEFTTDYIRDIVPIHIDFPLWIKGGHPDKIRFKMRLPLAKIWLLDSDAPCFGAAQEILFENDELIISRRANR
jgi:hypothetical protein